MPSPDLVIRARRVATPDAIIPASLYIRDEKIFAIGSFEMEVPRGCELFEAGENSLVMPGLVDSHVHINEPGRTDWEGFVTATRAAAAGGVTTLVDMPLNNIPATTTLEAFKIKLEAARGKLCVDTAFWGGVVPGNTHELAGMYEAGVVGFKCFLVHSGVDEFPNVTESDLREAMPELARLGALLIVHAELPGPIDEAQSAALEKSAQDYETFLRSRPRAAEDLAVALMIRLCRETGTRVHIVHHSSADSLPMLEQARAEGLPITVETCPHYLHFVSEDVPAGATEYKCCPPVRERENQEKLWQALGDGIIDMVVSDHSPCPPEMKRRDTGNFIDAWGGISSLQLRLPVMWTEAQRRGYSIEHLMKWLCSEPARLVGLEGCKGAIKVGQTADLCIWNTEETFVVKPSIIHHRHKLTPYNGKVLSGVVEQTFLRGEKIFDRGELAESLKGNALLRGEF
ncbi:MAG: allantoinase AllB [Pyrinomonadaceae bacterium]